MSCLKGHESTNQAAIVNGDPPENNFVSPTGQLP